MRHFIRLSSILCTVLCAAAACDDMDETMKEFQGDGPIVYLGKIDSLKVFSGKQQAKLTWAPSSDSRINGATIYWNNRSGQKEVEWNPSQPFETIVEDLREGSVVFEIVTTDAHGNTSVPVTISGNVFGESFETLLDDSATITSGFFDEEKHTIDLGLKHSSNFYYKFLKVEYTDSEGNKQSVLVEKGTETVTLENVSSPEVFYSSVFLPEEGCIDMFTSESHRYEDLYNPYCTVESESLLIATVEGGTASTTFKANRAPVSATANVEWLSAEVLNGSEIKVSTTAENSTGADRTGSVTLKAGEFTCEISVTQTRSHLGDAYGNEGVIFWQNPENAAEYKIISAARGDCMWSTESVLLGINLGTYQQAISNKGNWKSITGFTEINGVLVNNNDVIEARAAQYTGCYPAFEWCRNLGEGWYLPSGLELRAVFEAYNGTTFDAGTAGKPSGLTAAEKAARQKFEDTLVSIGGEKLNSQAESKDGDWVWSNMESSAANACGFRFGNRGFGARSKQIDATNNATYTFYTRAVKVVTIEQ